MLYDTREKTGGRNNLRRAYRGGFRAVFDKGKSYVGTPDGEFRGLAALYRIQTKTLLSDLVFVAVFRCNYSFFVGFLTYIVKKIRLIHQRRRGGLNDDREKNVNLTLQKNEILKNISAHFERGKIH